MADVWNHHTNDKWHCENDRRWCGVHAMLALAQFQQLVQEPKRKENVFQQAYLRNWLDISTMKPVTIGENATSKSNMSKGACVAETEFGQSDLGHPYLTDFGQSD